MELKEMIYKRKSVRKYRDVPVDAKKLQQIRTFAEGMRPLYPEIGIRWEFVTKEQVRFYFPWKTPQLIAIYSEEKDGYLENAGFLFQQMDLYLQSMGLGACWLGLGKVRSGVEAAGDDRMKFVILLAFGYPEGKALRADTSEFRRKALYEIADREDPRLEPARLAPSSTNSQPWYFIHEGEAIHAYCSRAGARKHNMLGTMNRIDMGIALAHLYVENPETFRFFRADSPVSIRDCDYTGSITL